MKTYIFFTGGIEGINGVVIYLDNKIKYLIDAGYRVFIVSPNSGTVYVKSLESYAIHMPVMMYYPSSYNKWKLESFAKKITNLFGDYCEQETIIESHNYNLACWGELIAKKMNCRHIHLLVTENPKVWTDEFYKFMRFKLERYELFGMNEKTIPMLMKGHMDLELSDTYLLKTPCDNTVQDVESDYINQIDPLVDYKICSVSRFDKPYVIPMIEQLEDFCREKKCTIQMFFIGGVYHEENLKKIQERLFNNEYIKYIFTGFQYPVSLKLLHAMDVAIGCAGSVLTTYRAGVPTIPLDVSDFKPIGIFGVTTNNTHYKDLVQKELSLTDLLSRILIQKEIAVEKICPEYGDLSSEFQIHFQKIAKCKKNMEYYDVSSVVNEGGSYRRRIKIMHVIGPRNFYRLDSLKHIIINRKKRDNE